MPLRATHYVSIQVISAHLTHPPAAFLPFSLSLTTVMLFLSKPGELPQALLDCNERPFQALQLESLREISQQHPRSQYLSDEGWKTALNNGVTSKLSQVRAKHVACAKTLGHAAVCLPTEPYVDLVGILRFNNLESMMRFTTGPLGLMVNLLIDSERGKRPRSSLRQPARKRPQPTRKQPTRKCKRSKNRQQKKPAG